MSSNNLISVEALTKKYRNVTALDGVSFTIRDGITGILGENGAGKSTAIKILLGLLRPTSGTAKVLGENAAENMPCAAGSATCPSTTACRHR